MPLDIGYHVGQFSHQHRDIKHYSTLGPKTSHTRWNHGGQQLSELKYKGLNLNGETASKQLTASIYDTQVKDFLLGIQNKVTVTQTKRYTYLNTLKKKWTTTELHMSNSIMKNRKLMSYQNLQTIPYGFPRK